MDTAESEPQNARDHLLSRSPLSSALWHRPLAGMIRPSQPFVGSNQGRKEENVEHRYRSCELTLRGKWREKQK